MALRRLGLVCCCLSLLLLVGPRGSAQSDEPLQFFKNYFVTGDYVAAGVGLDGLGAGGLATGTINVSGVPENAEALAAFLYWQVVSSDGPDAGVMGATFNSQPLYAPDVSPDLPGGPLATVANPAGTSPCWSSGGGTGKGGSKRTFTYRADVLRFIPVVDERHQLNGTHTVQLPDMGNSNKTPRALGATLVIVYRDPDPDAQLRAVVIYDGSHTLDNSTQSMSLSLGGFYDPLAGTSGTMTHIVGSAQANKDERLVVNGEVWINPFVAADGPSWDTYTMPTSSLSSDSIVTTVDNVGFSSFDCLTWGTVIYSTPVTDTDRDGLLDRWESSTTPILDPNHEALPNLRDMGADPGRPDVFIEIGYMAATTDLVYGADLKPAHTHRPSAEALRKVGEAFGREGIGVHFDVGDYPSGTAAEPYLVRIGARGGEWLDETMTQCSRGPEDPPWVCQFADYPGTVGWKSGFRFIRDGGVALDGSALDQAGLDACQTASEDADPTNDCRRRFDHVRKDIFRYVLFAHALGVPKEACIGEDGYPDHACQDTNPLFHVPVTNTGVGDFPGGDAMVALGGFSDVDGMPVGTDYMQAATLMHELGHTFRLRHGGAADEPNCKPNYLSVMNYLFQLRGLLDDAGVPHVNFSGQNLTLLDEGSLWGGIPGAPYRTGWYAPESAYTFGSAAKRYCDGRSFEDPNPNMVRVDSITVSGTQFFIEWDPEHPTSPAAQDINLDGTIGTLNPGHNDWTGLRLNQVGSRRNVGGWYWITDPATGQSYAYMGPMSLDVGRSDLGRSDLGRSDLGRSDLGDGDLGRGDLNRGDLGRSDLGRSDLGRSDLGRSDLGRSDLGSGNLGQGDLGLGSTEGIELDADLASSGGYAAPNTLQAWQVGLKDFSDNCDGLSPADCHRVKVRWLAPNGGLDELQNYLVYRVAGDTINPTTATRIATVPHRSGQVAYEITDTEELPSGTYNYFAQAEFLVPREDGSGTELKYSGLSNVVRFDPLMNEAPTATADPSSAAPHSYTTAWNTPLVIDEADGVLANDTDIDSPTLTVDVVTGPVNGTLDLNDDGSFTYTPTAGWYGTDTFTYRANDVDPVHNSTATVTIIVEKLMYGYVNGQNLPPPGGKEFQAGSAVPLRWQFTVKGQVIDSSAADPVITLIKGTERFDFPAEGDPGSSGLRPPTESNGWTWEFNLQTSNPLTGAPLSAGVWQVYIGSRQTGQLVGNPPPDGPVIAVTLTLR